jgi:hypothetical protein
MKRTVTFALAAAATMALATPAHAALTPTTPAFPCATNQVVPTADACKGWYRGNLNGVSASTAADTLAALKLLDPTITSLTVLEYLDAKDNPTRLFGKTIDFATILSGKTIIGIHKGGAKDFKQDGTAFFLWNNLAPTDKLTLNLNGLSNATLYMTTFSDVPEPGTWMLMILGVGLVGWQLRRRRQTVTLSYS